MWANDNTVQNLSFAGKLFTVAGPLQMKLRVAQKPETKIFWQSYDYLKTTAASSLPLQRA